MKTSLIIVLIATVLGVIAFVLLQDKPQATPPIPQTTSLPNLVFLNDCKTADRALECYGTKLLAFAKENGVEKTLALVRKAEKDFPELYQSCNYPLGHELGIKAYQETRDIPKALSVAIDCSAGFIRGVMAEFTRENQNVNFITLKERVCSPEQSSEGRCYYRLGYLAMQKAESLSFALGTCEALTKDEVLRNGCTAGAIHEAIFLSSTQPDYKIIYGSNTYKSGEELNLCNAMTQNYNKNMCYPSLARKYLFLSETEQKKFLENPLEICKNVPSDYKDVCLGGVGVTLRLIFRSDETKVRDLCMTGAGNDISSGWSCLKGILMIARINLLQVPLEKQNLCQLIPPVYREAYQKDFNNLCAK